MAETNDLPDTMRAFRVHQWGPDPIEALHLESIPLPTPEAGELLIRVEGIPLNLNDLERINGKNMMVRPELPVTPGMEVLGEVVAAAEGLEARIGERVVATTRQATGGFAEYAVGPTVSAFSMPASIPFPDAAALYFPFHLAWLGLLDRAELESGETVLIHAAAGGAGSAAIQIAKSQGAKVFATCGTDEKAAFCRSLGADVVINYETEDFKSIVLEATGNRGVDVVLDGVGEAVMDDSLACTAYNGRYVMLGFASGKAVADEKFIVPRRIAVGNLKLCGVLLSYVNDAMAGVMKQATGWNFCPDALGARITEALCEQVKAGSIRPVVGEVVDFEAIPDAITRMRDRKTIGRIIASI